MGAAGSVQAKPSYVTQVEGKGTPRATAESKAVPPLNLGESKQLSIKTSQSSASISATDRTEPRTPGRQARIPASGKSLTRANTLELLRGPCYDVLQALLDGNTRFVTGQCEMPHQDYTRIQQIAPKQHPIAAILGCADSRVPAEIVFDQGFGDIFVCRVAGNIATAEQIASLEYAVLDLGVRVIFVLGHTSCGAVKAALSGKLFPGYIETLIDNLDVAVLRAQSRGRLQGQTATTCAHCSEMLDEVIQENVRHQIDRCKRSLIISEAIQKQQVIVVGGVYNLETGQVEMLEQP